MLDDIMFFYDKNYGRINNLLELYTEVSGGNQGRKKVHQLDLLRAKVVLIHSTLEDYLRNLLLWRFPISKPDFMSKVPLQGFDRAKKFDFGDLIPHRFKTLDELFDESIRSYLDHRSFNNTTEIAGCLNEIGIEVDDPIKNLFNDLENLIARRHRIVHRADRSDQGGGSGFHQIQSISRHQVDKWQLSMDKFVSAVNRKINSND